MGKGERAVHVRIDPPVRMNRDGGGEVVFETKVGRTRIEVWITRGYWRKIRQVVLSRGRN